jgi:N-glycosylase/DNA lyase
MQKEVDVEGIRCMKIGMVIVLMVATYAAAFIAYQVTSSGEEWQEFETTYYDNANNIINDIEANLEETIASLDAFGG